jgi:hypothetical protein
MNIKFLRNKHKFDQDRKGAISNIKKIKINDVSMAINRE